MDNVDWSSWVNTNFFPKEFWSRKPKIPISLPLVTETDETENIQTCGWLVAPSLNLMCVIEIAIRYKKEADTELEQNDRNNF